jgi:hypothetical protein
MGSPELEEFRRRLLTPGKRVKPRVRRVAAVFVVTLILLGLGTIGAVIVLIVVFDLYGPAAPVSGTVVSVCAILFPIASQLLGRVLLTKLFVGLGWLTSEEGRDFAWMGHRFPPSCWEPFAEDD